MQYSQLKLQVNVFLLSSNSQLSFIKTHPYYFTFNLGVLKFQLNLSKQSRKACCYVGGTTINTSIYLDSK